MVIFRVLVVISIATTPFVTRAEPRPAGDSGSADSQQHPPSSDPSKGIENPPGLDNNGPEVSAESADAAPGTPIRPAEFESRYQVPTRFKLEGSWSVAATGEDSFPIDVDGNTLGQKQFAEHRLRIAPSYAASDKLKVLGEADLLFGTLAGQVATSPTGDFPYLVHTRDERDGLKQAEFRKLYVDWLSGVGRLRVGQMGSQWGLGIVANDGSADFDWGGPRFHGDLVDRVIFSTRPFAQRSETWGKLVVGLGGDLVYRDQAADLFDGDNALQGVMALVWSPEGATSRGGVYIVRRQQSDHDGEELNVWVLDLHGRLDQRLAESGINLRLEGEVTRVVGSTTISRDLDFPERDVRQFGTAAEVALVAPRWEALVQTGYASGDRNPNDKTVSSFEFDPEYRVGLILFQEVLAWQTAGSAARASDPTITGRPTPGIRLLPTEGAVVNALYVAPTVRVHIFPSLTAQGTVVWAKSATDFIDPYTTNALNGGYAVNFRGAIPRSRDLGQEVDLGLKWELPRTLAEQASLYLQAGRFLPGSAWDGPTEVGGEPQVGGEPAVPLTPINRIVGGFNLLW